MRQRKQTGHTNHWQSSPPVAGDLLGQSQVKRAARSGISVHTPHRSGGSEDTLQQQRRDESTPSQPPPPPPPPPLHAASPAGLCASHTSANPEHVFYIVSQQVVQDACPDAVLESLGSLWELHCPYLYESETIAELYRNSTKQRHTPLQDRTGEKRVRRGGGEMRLRQDGGTETSRGSLTHPVLLPLNINHPSVTKESLSFALRSMYRRDECPDEWCEAVLCTATLLRLPQLEQRCLKEMISSISFSTVCDFHRVSCKYKQESLQQACERWLELFLVTELSHRIHLRDVTFDLLHKTLLCPRATEVFLEQPLGQTYAPLFQALRLHGITEREHMEEMQKVNVFPHSWLYVTFSNLVHSIHSGGNMCITDFTRQAVRFGMTITGEHCTRTVGLYGFYFLLKASRVGESGAFAFSMERLRHWDPALAESCRTTQPFSMRAERCVRYRIRVQSCVCGEWQERSSGELNQVFGLSKRCCRSEVFTVDGLATPALVMFSLAFPST